MPHSGLILCFLNTAAISTLAVGSVVLRWRATRRLEVVALTSSSLAIAGLVVAVASLVLANTGLEGTIWSLAGASTTLIALGLDRRCCGDLVVVAIESLVSKQPGDSVAPSFSASEPDRYWWAYFCFLRVCTLLVAAMVLIVVGALAWLS